MTDVICNWIVQTNRKFLGLCSFIQNYLINKFLFCFKKIIKGAGSDSGSFCNIADGCFLGHFIYAYWGLR